MALSPRAILPAGAVAALLLVSACGSAGPTSAAPAPAPPAADAGCPLSSHATQAWPSPIPADLPTMPSARLGAVRRTPEGLTLVPFTTTTSLHSGVLFLVQALPRAGYTVGRGDAEATEADAPFVKGELRGVYRLLSRDTCSTQGLLALSRRTGPGAGGPLLPMRPSQAAASPLPFG